MVYDPKLEVIEKPKRGRKPKVKMPAKPRVIRVLVNYGGAPTRERRIFPGDYYEDDPAIFGLADYLTEHPQMAIWIADIEYFYSSDNQEG
jgi:hypothetical protein